MLSFKVGEINTYEPYENENRREGIDVLKFYKDNYKEFPNLAIGVRYKKDTWLTGNR